jgi:predicted ATPase/DNA-binding CsgD family transcriptional regulator
MDDENHNPLSGPLTARELEVLTLIAAGLSNREIAHELTLTLGTVKWYTRQIYNKLGVNSRTQAVARAQDVGLFDTKSTASAASEYQPRHNLPAQLTSFIGREQEIAEIKALLSSHRLLTLTGSPGTGKSRLSLQVAEQVINDFKHGVFFVDLAPLQDPTLVVHTIAHAIESARFANEPADRTSATLKSLINKLFGKTVLLILDNFEHILDAANVVADLLVALPQLTVMITSREALHIYGEQEYFVPPLKLPDQQQITQVSALLQSEAIALFVQRAQAVLPEFVLSDENTEAVTEICCRLDGLPLAIELAAARVKMLSPEVMLTRLKSRLDTLTGGSRDLPVRLQNLRNTIDWSYELLEEAEKVLFARLSVFQGGRTVESAEAICGPGLTGDVLGGLEALLNKSLLQAEDSSTGEMRFYMLETIHEYATERLENSGEAEQIRKRHADYFVALAERARVVRTTGSGQWHRRLKPEIDNMRTAMRWSLATSSAANNEAGIRLAAALCDYWYYEGHLTEGRRWVELALGRSADASPELQASILSAAGMLAYFQNDHEQGKAWSSAAQTIYAGLGDELNEAWALVWLGGHQMGCPDNAKTGMQFCEKAIATFRQEDHKAGLAWAHNMLGELARLGGDYILAGEAYKECINVCRETGAVLREAMTRANLGFVELHQGNYEQAEILILTGLGREAFSKYHTAYAFAFLAGPVAAKGDPEQAARLLGASEAILDRIGAVITTSDQHEIERFVNDVKAQLDKATFEAAWAEGQAMTYEEAVACALGEKRP